MCLREGLLLRTGLSNGPFQRIKDLLKGGERCGHIEQPGGRVRSPGLSAQSSKLRESVAQSKITFSTVNFGTV